MSYRFSASAPLDGWDESPHEYRTHGELDGKQAGRLDGKQAGRLAERLALSFEVIPPRHDAKQGRADQEKIVELLDTLESYDPDYVAVTSSRRSGWLEGTAQFIAEIAGTTSMRPLAHLACTAGPVAEVRNWINILVDSGVRGFLALRGDLEPGETALPAGYLQHADALVRLIRQMESAQATRFGAGRLAVGVACYPNGHAESRNQYEDLDVLLNKQRLGSDLAISQLFFRAEDFLRFSQRASLAGVNMPLVPGVMPVTSAKRLRRMSELSSLAVPQDLVGKLEAAPNAQAEYDIGLEWTVTLINQLIRGGVQGIHLYTHNNPQVTRDVMDNIDVPSLAMARS